ncbi:uncharacterized protein Dvar_35400 [Desulfosarcina variabilis str. Montpellier]
MINYCIFPKYNLIAICNWGDTPVQEVLEFSRNLRANPLYSKRLDVIIDNSQLKTTYTQNEVGIMSEPERKTSNLNNKIAIIAPSDIHYGISRMHDTVAKINKNTYNISVFRDARSALKWLNRTEINIENVFKTLQEEYSNKMEKR